MDSTSSNPFTEINFRGSPLTAPVVWVWEVMIRERVFWGWYWWNTLSREASLVRPVYPFSVLKTPPYFPRLLWLSFSCCFDLIGFGFFSFVNRPGNLIEGQHINILCFSAVFTWNNFLERPAQNSHVLSWLKDMPEASLCLWAEKLQGILACGYQAMREIRCCF